MAPAIACQLSIVLRMSLVISVVIQMHGTWQLYIRGLSLCNSIGHQMYISHVHCDGGHY